MDLPSTMGQGSIIHVYFTYPLSWIALVNLEVF